MSEIADRVDVATDVLGHPHIYHDSVEEEPPVEEGTHYETLAYTHWGDYFVPTVVRWAHGETDSFRDRKQSLLNRADAVTEARLEADRERFGAGEGEDA